MTWRALTATEDDGRPAWVVRNGQKTAHRVLMWNASGRDVHVVCGRGLGGNWRPAEKADRQCASCH